jgi:proteasome lid subunit RPN8/RPN11
MIAHARRERPRECCGLLIGFGSRVSHALAMRNIARSPARYALDPAEHIGVRRLLRGCSPPLEIVGVYHSHPSSDPVPSPTDLKEAHYPDWIYAIVSLRARRADVRAFQIRGKSGREVRILG